eukprot:116570-Chlamydomonas_euryale.AAC.4
MKLVMRDSAIDYLATKGFDPVFGARCANALGVHRANHLALILWLSVDSEAHQTHTLLGNGKNITCIGNCLQACGASLPWGKLHASRPPSNPPRPLSRAASAAG